MVDLDNLTKTQSEILYAISKFLTSSQIAKYRKTSRTAVFKTLNVLLNKGLVNKIERGVYELTPKGRRGLANLIGFTNRIRLHSLAIKVKILESKANWGLKRNNLLNLTNFNKKVSLNNTDYEILNISNVKIKTTTQSVIFYLPSFYDSTIEGATSQAMNLFFDTIPKVENLFKIKLTKDRKLNMEIISQHYAKLNDALAKLYRKKGDKLFIHGEDGKVWIIADYSFSTDELETVHTINAKEDMETVSRFFNDLRKNPATISQLSGMIQQVTANQIVFDKNMKSHIKAIQELGSGVQKFNKRLDSIIPISKRKPKVREINENQTQIDNFL